jgi:hypothetical protein
MVNFDILVHTALTHLHNTIKSQIEATNRQSRIMIFLAWAAVFLGVAQVIGTIV